MRSVPVRRRFRQIAAIAAAVVVSALVLPLEAAASNTPILGPTQTDVSTAQLWATNRNAARQFVDIAPLFWQIAPTRGGVRPEVAYAQSALETGYGRFGGRIDATWHNPCGLKTGNATGDEPDDHKRFASWAEGITACVDHLALYAGAPGYPRADTPDERHWSFLFGRASTVESLGGNWAPSPDYGTRVAALIDSILGGSSWDPGVPVPLQFNAYDFAFRGGVFVAGGNVDGSPGDEIVTGAGPGGGPHVRVLSHNGTALVDRSGFFAYASGFRGGVSVATGDVDNDGVDEIVTGAGPGGGPHVTVRKWDGRAYPEIGGFFAYGSGFRGGVWVAAGDVDGLPGDEVITGAGPGASPHVVVWKHRSGNFVPTAGFYAYGRIFPGGVSVGAVDVDGDGVDEVITGAGPGGGPHVKALRQSGSTVSSFFAYGSSFLGGVTVGGTGSRLAVGTATGAPHTWSADDPPLPFSGPEPGSVDLSAYAFKPFDASGVRVAAADVDPNTPGTELLVSQGPGGRPVVRVLATP